jgi:hypothetical protein
VLYWALAGNAPIDASPLDSDAAGRASQPTYQMGLSFRDDVPVDLRDLCQRCLAPSPASRTIAMREISAALRAMA